MVAFELFATLVDIGNLDRLPPRDLALVGLFHTHDHLEQGRLAGAVRADDADDRAMRHDKAQVINQQAIAE